MGPALTHVSMKYGDSGWKHVTAEEAEALFPKQSVPAAFQRGHANLSANAAVNMSLLLKTASMCVILNIAEEKRIRPVRKE